MNRLVRLVRLVCLIGLVAAPWGVSAQAPAPPAGGPPALASLITATPAEGFDLAVRLARRAVPMMQRDAAVRGEVRQHYARDGEELISAAQVVALHFQ